MSKYRSFNSDNDANYFAACVATRLNIDSYDEDLKWPILEDVRWAILDEGAKHGYDMRYWPKLRAKAKAYNGWSSVVYTYFNATFIITRELNGDEYNPVFKYTVTGRLTERL